MLFSEPKIPQSEPEDLAVVRVSSFSALQRAENSSIVAARRSSVAAVRFSALQRAENSSIALELTDEGVIIRVSVLFSEPKIPQSFSNNDFALARGRVSVLFSEPKIPQSAIRCCFAARLGVSVLFSEPKIPQSQALA